MQIPLKSVFSDTKPLAIPHHLILPLVSRDGFQPQYSDQDGTKHTVLVLLQSCSVLQCCFALNVKSRCRALRSNHRLLPSPALLRCRCRTAGGHPSHGWPSVALTRCHEAAQPISTPWLLSDCRHIAARQNPHPNPAIHSAEHDVPVAVDMGSHKRSWDGGRCCRSRRAVARSSRCW
jgi:hypothetical protein